jgi:hypothetical protein
VAFLPIPECGSSICELSALRPELLVTNTGTLDDPTAVTPIREIYCDRALPWVQLGIRYAALSSDADVTIIVDCALTRSAGQSQSRRDDRLCNYSRQGAHVEPWTRAEGANAKTGSQRLDITDQIVDFGAGQRLYPAVRMRQDNAELVLAHTALGDRAKARVTTGAPLLRNLVAFLGIGMRSAAGKQRRYCHKCD